MVEDTVNRQPLSYFSVANLFGLLISPFGLLLLLLLLMPWLFLEPLFLAALLNGIGRVTKRVQKAMNGLQSDGLISVDRIMRLPSLHPFCAQLLCSNVCLAARCAETLCLAAVLNSAQPLLSFCARLLCSKRSQ